MSKIVKIALKTNAPVQLEKWKVKEGMPVGARQLLFMYHSIPRSDPSQMLKYKSSDVGTISKLLVKEGDIVKPGDEIILLEECKHPTVMKDMCAECGADLRQEDSMNVNASVPMVHSIPELKVSEEIAMTLGKADEVRLLKDKKLVLLVDLDQTLIHTTNDNIPPNLRDVVHFQLYGPHSPWYHTRIRPGTEKFLESVSELYELHICTFGARNYAHYIALFLDPDGRFFSHRILSRDECFDANSKTANLKALFPCGDSMVCIIDDREDVWNYAPNLIHVKPYHFFQHTGDINAPPGLTKKDNDKTEDGYDFTTLGQSKSKDGKEEPSAEKKSSAVGPSKRKSVRSGETTTDKDTEDEKETREKITMKRLSQNIDQPDVSQVEEAINDSLETLEDESNSRSADVKEAREEKCESLGNIAEMFGDDSSQLEGDIGGTKSEEKPVQNGTSAEGEVSNNSSTLGEKKSTENGELESSIQCKPGLVSEEVKQSTETSVEVKTAEVTSNATEKVKDEAMEVEEAAKTTEPSSEVKTDAEKPETVKMEVDGTAKPADSTSSTQGNKETKKVESPKKEDDMIDVEDTDDYLLYLEDILKKIHARYYEEYNSKEEKAPLPDLKVVIPNVKRKVLAGCHLVFSGLVPSHVPLQRSRAYAVALSLGATVSGEVSSTTTHLVAARAGTAKVNSSRRQKGVFTVTPHWLWHCAERWEKVDERLYPLARGVVTNRHPPAHCGSPQHPGDIPLTEAQPVGDSSRFSDTINPLLSFSSEEMQRMDQEVEDLCADDTDSEESASERAIRSPVLPIVEPDTSSCDSMQGGVPKGWTSDGPKAKKFKRDTTTCTESDLEEESPSAKFRRGEPLPSDLDLGDESRDDTLDETQDSQDDAAWNLMGAALEREFLSGD